MLQSFIKPFEFRANSDLTNKVAQINLIYVSAHRLLTAQALLFSLSLLAGALLKVALNSFQHLHFDGPL